MLEFWIIALTLIVTIIGLVEEWEKRKNPKRLSKSKAALGYGHMQVKATNARQKAALEYQRKQKYPPRNPSQKAKTPIKLASEAPTSTPGATPASPKKAETPIKSAFEAPTSTPGATPASPKKAETPIKSASERPTSTPRATPASPKKAETPIKSASETPTSAPGATPASPKKLFARQPTRPSAPQSQVDRVPWQVQYRLDKLIDRKTLERLLTSYRFRFPDKSEKWIWEKMLYDLERDRGVH